MHPKAYAIVEKESGKIGSLHLTRYSARIEHYRVRTLTRDLGMKKPEFRIIPVEIKKLKK